jgi:hypothetical protein
LQWPMLQWPMLQWPMRFKFFNAVAPRRIAQGAGILNEWELNTLRA